MEGGAADAATDAEAAVCEPSEAYGLIGGVCGSGMLVGEEGVAAGVGAHAPVAAIAEGGAAAGVGAHAPVAVIADGGAGAGVGAHLHVAVITPAQWPVHYNWSCETALMRDLVRVMSANTRNPQNAMRQFISDYHEVLMDLLVMHGSVNLHGFGKITIHDSRPARLAPVYPIDRHGRVRDAMPPSAGWATFIFEPCGALKMRAITTVRHERQRLWCYDRIA